AAADFLDGVPTLGVIAGTAVRQDKLTVVVARNGAQFTGMGHEALRTDEVFRAAVEEVDGLIRPELGWSVTELLENQADSEMMARADVAQPLLFAVQVGIVQALGDIGTCADAHLGHSVGEIAAAWASGAL